MELDPDIEFINKSSKTPDLDCPFCSRRFSLQLDLKYHVRNCLRNPDNKTCFGCENFIRPKSKTGRTCLEGYEISDMIQYQCDKYKLDTNVDF